MVHIIANKTLFYKIEETTLIVPMSACGINSRNMHYFAKSQN